MVFAVTVERVDLPVDGFLKRGIAEPNDGRYDTDDHPSNKDVENPGEFVTQNKLSWNLPTLERISSQYGKKC